MSSHQLALCQQIKPAQIIWRDGEPYSTEFGDIYFSSDNGIAESEHVFIQGCDLVNRWQQSTASSYSILELGFGSGLNFLLTLDHWLNWQKIRKTSKTKGQLTTLRYASIEMRPFQTTDFLRAANHWPHLRALAETVAAQLPAQIYGIHPIDFERWQLRLHLIYMPVEQALTELLKQKNQLISLPNELSKDNFYFDSFRFDSFYLDGFAPTLNPDMWQQTVASKLSLLAKPGANLSTFSVAAPVKKALANSDFVITKKKGYGRKREMLTAALSSRQSTNNGRPDPASSPGAVPDADNSKIKPPKKKLNLKYDTPWYQSKSVSGKHVAIIGAGIAGCSMAWHLARKGFDVSLFEASEKVAAGASGAAAGIFHPQLTTDFNIGSQLHFFAYDYLARFIAQRSDNKKQDFVINQGVDRLFSNTNDETGTSIEKAHKLLSVIEDLKLGNYVRASYVRASHFKTSSKNSDSTGIYYPFGAAIDVEKFCHFLLADISPRRYKLNTSHRLVSLHQHANQWRLEFQTSAILEKDRPKNNIQEECSRDSGNLCSTSELFDHVVFCCGHNLDLLPGQLCKNLHTTRGQTALFSSDQLSTQVQQVICDDIYLVPKRANQFLLGSTFESGEKNRLSRSSQVKLFEKLNRFLSRHHIAVEIEQPEALMGSWGYRLHTQDRFPLCGPVPDFKKLTSRFASAGQKQISYDATDYFNQPGLWLNCGYGSHGLLLSMLNAANLTAQLSGELLPGRLALCNAQHPARFFIKDLIKSC